MRFSYEKHFQTRTLVTLVLCMLAACLSGCGAKTQTTYKTYFSTSYPSLNYFSTSYATVREIATNCIDGLVEPDIYGNYIPSMAESWEHNEDYTAWTFKIRKDMKWIDHTGDPLNGAYSLHSRFGV